MRLSLLKILGSALLGQLIIFSPLFVYAQPNAFPNEAWTLQDIVDLMGVIRNFFLIAGVIAVVVFMIWSGISYLTAGGNDQKLKDAKKRFLWTIIGTAIVLATFAIISTITAFLAKDWL